MKQKRGKRITKLHEEWPYCSYCDIKTTLDLGYIHTAVVDHVKPLSQGGDRFHTNEVLCCNKCNADKSDTKLIIWLWQRGDPDQRPPPIAQDNVMQLDLAL